MKHNGRPGGKGQTVSAGWVCQVGLNPLPEADTRLLHTACIFSVKPHPGGMQDPGHTVSTPAGQHLLLHGAQEGPGSSLELREPRSEARSGSPREETPRNAEVLTQRVPRVGTACRESIARTSRLKAVKYSRVKRKSYKKDAWLRQCSAETLMPSPALVSSSPKHSSRGRASVYQEEQHLMLKELRWLKSGQRGSSGQSCPGNTGSSNRSKRGGNRQDGRGRRRE